MGNITLRALTSSDIEQTLRWNNDEEIKYFYSGHPFPVNIESERKWYENVLTSNIPLTVFGIETREDHKLVGLTVLRNIQLINREAEFGIYIGEPAARGKGYSREATSLSLDFGFNKLGLNRIFVRVMEDDLKAIGLYKKTGFVSEGVLREAVYKNGKFHNYLVMSVLKSEFIPQ